MAIELEPYSAEKADIQAELVHELVVREEEFLRLYFPSVASGYGDLSKATDRIARVAASPEVNAFIVVDPRQVAAHGLATILFDQRYKRTDSQMIPIVCDDLDYWLDAQTDASLDNHDAVATRLIEHDIVRQHEAHGGIPKLIVAANRLERKSRPPIGLMGRMRPLGVPGRFLTDPADDPHSLTKDGALLQLNILDPPSIKQLR